MFTDESLEGLQDRIDEHPEAKLKDMREFLRARYGIEPHITTISGVLANFKITNKTIVRVPDDRNTRLLSQERMEWALTRRYLEKAGAAFVHIDEAGFNLHLTSQKGRAIVGCTPEMTVPRSREQNIPLLAALIPGRRAESYHNQRGPIRSGDMVRWPRENLMPHCRRVFGGRPVVVVMDNAQCRGLAVQTCIAEEGYRYLETIPCSPQTNPIERMFSRVKSYASRGTRANGNELIAQIEEGIRNVAEHSTDYLRAHLSVLEPTQRGSQLGSDHVFKLTGSKQVMHGF